MERNQIIVGIILVLALGLIGYSMTTNPCNCTRPNLLDSVISSFNSSKNCSEWELVNSKLEELKASLETNNSESRSAVEYYLPDCLGEEQTTYIKFSKTADDCHSFCSLESDSCYLLAYSHPEREIKKCLTGIAFSEEENCKIESGFKVKNLEEITQGKYLITKNENAEICLYLEE